jgi:uroporphyrinogen III methyltransferase / synthase
MNAGRLAGCRLLVTRPVEQAEAWRASLEAAGAVVLSYPTIDVRPPPSWEPLDTAFARLQSYDWLVFSSAAAVRFATSRLPEDLDPTALSRPQIAAVGGETARALTTRGFRVARVPEDQRAEGLVAAFGDLPAGSRVLFPQAMGGRDALAASLRARGCVVDVVPASETVARADLPPLPAFDVASFASPSALDAFVARHGAHSLAGAPVVVIGTTTAAAAHAHGLRPIVARAPRIEEVVEAVALARHPRKT